MGTAAGTRGSGRGLRHLGGLRSPTSAGQRPAGGSPPCPASDAAPDPQRGNSLDIKGDQSREGTSHRGTTFLPLPPLLPVVLFLVTSFPWQQKVGGGGGGSAGKSLLGKGHRDTSRKTMWSAEAGNGLEARVGLGKIGRRGEGGGRQPLPAPSQGCE